MQKLIVGISGATGSVFGVRLLQTLRDTPVETHLVVSKWGLQTLEHETGIGLKALRAMATEYYSAGAMGAAISSGSFQTDGMVIAPCSMRSVAAIAHGSGEHLLHRAADVVLKERRRLVLVARETPLNDIHLENLLKLSRMGVVILPPMPAFYHHPQTLDDLINHTVMRILDQFEIPLELVQRWDGNMSQCTPRLHPLPNEEQSSTAKG